MERAVIWSAKVRCSSKMKPRFRAEWEVSSEELCILASWFLSPMSKNSVRSNHGYCGLMSPGLSDIVDE